MQNKSANITSSWRVNTPQLLKEVQTNHGAGVLRVPLQIFANILFEVGEAAARINDPELNALMVRLAIYEIGDPYSKGYDDKFANEVMEKGEQAKKKRKQSTK